MTSCWSTFLPGAGIKNDLSIFKTEIGRFSEPERDLSIQSRNRPRQLQNLSF
jgi:hypothetical protein